MNSNLALKPPSVSLTRMKKKQQLSPKSAGSLKTSGYRTAKSSSAMKMKPINIITPNNRLIKHHQKPSISNYQDKKMNLTQKLEKKSRIILKLQELTK